MIIYSNQKVSIEMTPDEALVLIQALSKLVGSAITNKSTGSAWASIPAGYKKDDEDHHRHGTLHIRVEV